MGLISIAIALPVSVFLARCFGIANSSEGPESWLEWVGWRKFVFGPHAHRKWHYTGPKGQPNRHVKWFIRSIGAPPPETAINLWHSLVAWVTRTEPPWTEEWREAMETKEAEEAEKARPDAGEALTDKLHQDNGKDAEDGNLDSNPPWTVERREATEADVAVEAHPDASEVLADKLHEENGKDAEDAEDDDAASDGGSTSSSVRSARELARYKRMVALSGFLGIYICWAIFSWCAHACAPALAAALTLRP